MRKERLAIVKIDESKCTGCGLCVDACPVKAITLEDVAKIDESLCRGCCVCMDECPNDAIYLSKKKPAPAFQRMGKSDSSRIFARPASGLHFRPSSDGQSADFRQTASGSGFHEPVFDFFNMSNPSLQGQRRGAGRGQGCGKRMVCGQGRGRGGGNRRHM